MVFYLVCTMGVCVVKVFMYVCVRIEDCRSNLQPAISWSKTMNGLQYMNCQQQTQVPGIQVTTVHRDNQTNRDVNVVIVAQLGKRCQRSK